MIGQPGAAWARGLVRRAEHEVVDEELRPPVEELGERLLPLLGVEGVLLLDGHPRQRLPLLRQLLVELAELLLTLVQRRDRGLPLLLRSYVVLRHRVFLLPDLLAI